MSRAISYFIFSSTGSYLRWEDDLNIGFVIRSYPMSITGGSGIDRFYAGAVTQVDATGLFASAGVDQLYFSGSFGDYTQTVSSSGVYTFTGRAGGSHAGEVISFSMTSSGDQLVFADYSVNVQLSTFLNTQTNTFALIQLNQLTAGAQPDPASTAVAGNSAAKVFVFDSRGINIPQLPLVGESIAVTGGSGADSFYVRKGTSADATGLFASAGVDVLYLTGRFTDYTQTVSSGGVYTFTRNFTGADLTKGLSEVISFSMTSSGDKLVFADGGGTLQLSHYLSGSSFAPILASDLSATPTTPGLPTITAVLISGVNASGMPSNTLGVGDVLHVTLTTSATLSVQDYAFYTLQVGTTQKVASYSAALSSGNTLVFTYTIVAGDNDASGGITAPSNALLLGGTLRDVAGNDLNPAVNAVTSGANTLQVTTSGADVTAPSVLNIALIAASGAQNRRLNAGDIVTASVLMSEGVTVSGTPTLALSIGGNTVQASYASGSGSNTLLFTYAILSGENESNGISIPSNALQVTAGSIHDAANNSANLSFGAVTSNTNYAVDTTPPSITSLSLSGNAVNGTLYANALLTVTVGMSETVIVNGAPQLMLNIGGSSVQAQYVAGSGTNSLLFTYSIAFGLRDDVGISVPANAFALGTASISDLAGNVAQLNSNAISNNPNFKVFTPHVALSAVGNGTGGFVINGQAFGDGSGASIAMLGDINGDGFVDFMIGAPASANNAGQSYVVFGKANWNGVSALQLSAIAAGSGGFVINGQTAGETSAYSVSAIGDINADGYADFAVTSPNAIISAAPNAIIGAGRSAVIFGQANWSGSALNLSAIAAGSGGFVLNGQLSNDQSGYSIAAAGDVNGDGISDFIIGAPAILNPINSPGVSYVVFGRTSWSGVATLGLSSITAGSGGFIIFGQAVGDQSGSAVTALGDINGDGLADLFIGSPYAGAGKGYVVFGKTNTASVSLGNVANGSGGFVITGQATGDLSGYSVAGLGDVNGDGIADVLIGAPNAGTNAGKSYVVFGKANASAVDLNAVAAGSGGFVITGQGVGDQSAKTVAGLGDFNGDGLADFIIGAPNNAATGSAYIVFGKTDTNPVSLNNVANGQGGFAIQSALAGDLRALSVTGAGDINGDGFADVLIGAREANSGAGKSYVIFGGAGYGLPLSRVVQGSGTVTGTSANEVIVGGSGADVLSGGGGVDRYFGGAGDDVIMLTSSDITNLASNTPTAVTGGSVLSTVDGGTGIDTIRLTGGANLDLTAIANIAVGNPNFKSRIASIEGIDLATDSLANTLTLNVSDVLDMAGMNSFNTSNGWSNGTGSALSASVQKHQLLINGTTADTLIAAGGWLPSSDTVRDANAQTYRVYNSYNGTAQLLVSMGVKVAPLVTGITVNAAPNRVFLNGALVSVVVNVSEVVSVSGTPQLALTIGGVTVQANYVSGSNSANLVFTYLIQAGQFDSNGISVAANSLSFSNGASVVSASNGLNLVLNDVAATDNINASVDTAQVRLANIANGSGGFVISGQLAGDQSGWSVAGAGDVNGDGFADVLISAVNANSGAGKSYVVFGKTNTLTVNLSAVANGSGGFVINGQASNNLSGWSVAGVGDVNGDGLSDVLISAPNATVGTNAYAGKAYVVFGKTNTSAVDLSAVANGSGGFVMNGPNANELVGFKVSAAGDVNGDGLADLLVSSTKATGSAGASYVIFGASNLSAVNLSAVSAGSGGFVITGQNLADQSGYSIASVGDVNGDGLSDMLISAPPATVGANASAGKSYVVFGKMDGASVDLNVIAAGTGGFVISGQNAGDYSGWSVAGVGDVNGDGMTDMLINANNGVGKTFVVFGASNNNINLSAIEAGSGGFVIYSAASFNNAKSTVAALGDFNGDGLADFLISTFFADNQRGLSYVVYGKSTTSAIQLSDVLAGSGGFVISGEQAGDFSGYQVTAAGDVNGDGFADVLVSSPAANVGSLSAAGKSYVILGGPSSFNPMGALQQGSGMVTGTAANEAIVGSSGADVLSGGGGVDRYFGGAGNDTIVLTAGDIANLASTTPSNGLSARVDGGTGLDTLRLSGGANLDLTAIANMAVGNPTIKSRIASIERIDLATDSLANTLILNANDVLDMAGMNSFNTSNGWLNVGAGTAFSANSPTHQLVIDGTAADTLITSGWVLSASGLVASNISGSTQQYRVYNSTTSWAQLLVASTINVLPFISNVGIYSASNIAGVYRTADVVTAWVYFSETVSVTGTPQLALNIGGQSVLANYSAKTADNQGLLFTYAIQSGQFDASGIRVAANSLNLNNGSIVSVANGRAMSLLHAVVPSNPSALVDSAKTRLDDILAAHNGFVINGQVYGDQSSYHVSNVGDVNGDGLNDMLIVAPNASTNPSTKNAAGKAYLVFGKTNTSSVDLNAVAAGTGGFVINGQPSVYLGGSGVSPAGDLNGDGRADFIVMASATATQAQTAYVVYGKQDGGAVVLSSLAAGSGGFAISATGYALQVVSAGDVNGDGWSDLLVQTAVSSLSGNNASYVIFGGPNLSAVNLSAVTAGTGGFKINAAGQGNWAALGDVNGDGLGDLAQGLPQLDTVNSANPAGIIYVVFGKADTSAVGANSNVGFVIQGENSADNAGWVVTAAGDVNGDGLADLLVSAPLANNNAGKTYVVFGKRDNNLVYLSAVAAGSGGFVINGYADIGSGYRVSTAGDLNGDGLADVFIGAPTGGRPISGATGSGYVVFGKTNTVAVNLSNLTASGGFVLDGLSGNDGTGWSVSTAGDVNGDGFYDLLLGAPGANLDSGASYVILGGADFISGALVQGSGTVTGTVANEAIVGSSNADILTGGGGIDRFFGGAGNDTIVLTASDIANLSSTVSQSVLSTVDGGSGIDTLRLTAGASLDLTAISNLAAGSANFKSRIASIERIDLATDTTRNTLTLALGDVLDITGLNNFNTGNGWTNASGAALSNAVAKHQLVIDGGAADVVNLHGAWVQSQTAGINDSVSHLDNGVSHSYYVYNNGYAQLLVDSQIVPVIVP